jgi:hypothetical protein
MSGSASPTTIPGWVKWLIVFLTAIGLPAALLLLLRWQVMRQGHQKALLIVQEPQSASALRDPRGVSALPRGSPQSEAARSVPASDLPLIGGILAGDSVALAELEKLQAEIRELMNAIRASRVDGLVSFRTLLAAMGHDVPDAMTEAEAAAEFLRHAERFAGPLAEWRQALDRGPWDFGTFDLATFQKSSLPVGLTQSLSSLMSVMTEAQWRVGDNAAAWSTWQTMRLAGSHSPLPPCLISALVQTSVQGQLLHTMRSGLRLGGWQDDQLTAISTQLAEESPLHAMHRAIEGEKAMVSGTFAHLKEDRATILEIIPTPLSPIESFINRIGLSLVTDQQLADNQSVLVHAMESQLANFDPDTGHYLPPSPAESQTSADPLQHGSWFEKFYFMFADLSVYDGLPSYVIRSQSSLDQGRIAVALELHRRATGTYPDNLDAVNERMAGAIPVDPATGAAYFYRRTQDGGYSLWGTGIDRASQGGDAMTDVTWSMPGGN